MLCQQVMSNKTYVSQAFRKHASTSFNEYVNRCRINYVAERLESGLSTDLLKDVFFEAGFRTHSTAYTSAAIDGTKLRLLHFEKTQ